MARQAPTRRRPTPRSSVAKPVARLNDLSTGGTTAIKLDQGFVDALTSLKLTPGVVDGAKLEDGSLIFPITGGNVTYFKPGTAKPYVIGQIQHEASGLSLTAGDTKVELTNFNVDPGISRVYGDVTVNGKVAATSAFLFQLRGATLKPLQAEGNTAILEGTKVLHQPGRSRPAERHLQDRRGDQGPPGGRREDHRQHQVVDGTSLPWVRSTVGAFPPGRAHCAVCSHCVATD